MSKGKIAPLGLAQTLSSQLMKMLEPHCEKIMVAGSVRRARPMVGDIEIVALAQETSLSDLFGQQVKLERTTLDDALDQLSDQDYQGWRVDPRLNGHKHKRLRHLHTEMQADMYVTLDRRAWGALVAVRTGPVRFSKHIVNTALGKGWHFADGFLLHAHLRGRHPCPQGPACDKIIPLPHETDVFEQLRIKYLSPEDREGQFGVVL